MKGKSASKKFTTLFLVSLVVFVVLSETSVQAYGQTDEAKSVIVGFKGSIDRGLIEANGGTIDNCFEDIAAAAATMPIEAVEVLRENPEVAYVEDDSRVQMLQQTVSWGVRKIDAPSVWASGNKGTKIKVAVLDTGIAAENPDLHVIGGVSFVSGVAGWNDDNGHGTHCAGIIAALDNGLGVVGVAPEAALYAVKVLDKNGAGAVSNIINGIEWCITQKIQVISMSFGSSTSSAALNAECEKAYNAGIVLVAAAGNAGPQPNTLGYPAKYSSVISVGATMSNDEIAPFSSRGPELSVAAPGVGINSTYLNNMYLPMSGTSMACPHVAGTVALVLENKTCTPAEMKNILQTTAVDLGVIGPDSDYGFGRIDAVASIGGDTRIPNPNPDFTMSAYPSPVVVAAGSSATFNVEFTSLNGFHGTVSLDKVIPAYWSATFSPSTVFIDIEGSSISRVSVAVPAYFSEGTYTISVIAFSETISHRITVPVNVQPPQPDYSLTPSSSYVDVMAGSYVTFTLKVTSFNGFHGRLTMDKKAPSDWIGAFSPPKLTVNPGGTSYTKAWITVPTTATAGTYTVTVLGLVYPSVQMQQMNGNS